MTRQGAGIFMNRNYLALLAEIVSSLLELQSLAKHKAVASPIVAASAPEEEEHKEQNTGAMNVAVTQHQGLLSSVQSPPQFLPADQEPT